MTALTRALTGRRDAGQPFLTYYDAASGERIELSAVTTANWVAKTSGFLVDGLDVEPGTRVRLGLPSHWERVVWLLACWGVGATVVDAAPADVGVCGPDLDATEDVRVALSLRPLGLRFAEAPAGFVDFNAEVLGHPDVFVALDEPDEDTPALVAEGRELDHAALVAAAGTDGRRLLVRSPSLVQEALLVVAAARGEGSLVLVSGGNEADAERLAAQERAEPVTP